MFVQRLPNVFQMGVWNSLGRRCTNVAGSLGCACQPLSFSVVHSTGRKEISSSSSSSSSDFLLTCRYRGHIHNSGPPSRLAARMADLTPDLQVSLSWGSIAESFHSLRSLSVSCFQVILGLPGPRFPLTCMSVLTAPLERSTCPYQRSLLSFSMRSRSSIPSRASSSVDLMVAVSCGLHCISVWSLLCHFAADAGGRALLLAMFHWHGALRSAHTCCTHGHVSWKKGGGKRELVSAPWTSSKQFSHVLWFKAHNHRLLRACLLGSKRKLPPPVCQARLGLLSVVCRLRGVLFPCTV